MSSSISSTPSSPVNTLAPRSQKDSLRTSTLNAPISFVGSGQYPITLSLSLRASLVRRRTGWRGWRFLPLEIEPRPHDVIPLPLPPQRHHARGPEVEFIEKPARHHFASVSVRGVQFTQPNSWL